MVLYGLSLLFVIKSLKSNRETCSSTTEIVSFIEDLLRVWTSIERVSSENMITILTKKINDFIIVVMYGTLDQQFT